MQLLLEFADSEVSRVEITREGLVVHFAAAQVHRIEDVTSGQETVGYALGVELVLHRAREPSPASDCFGRVARGRVEIDGGWQKRVQLPLRDERPARLELAFANGADLRAAGQALACRFTGEPNFAESLFC